MKKFTLAKIAELTNAQLIGNPKHEISNVDSLESATTDDASFLANPRYTEIMKKSNAGVICIDHEDKALPGKNYLISKNPSYTFQQIAKIILNHDNRSGFLNIDPQSKIHPTVKLGDNLQIGPFAVIDQNTTIDHNTTIGANTYIGPNVTIGKDCYIYPNVVIREGCVIKDRVIIQPGAVIGSCGFGYLTDEKGIHLKLEQMGNVILEEDVEIGANSTIDRARFKSTIIRRGTKIDNLVQIAHNVEIGSFNIIAAQTGIAGSVKTGKYVMCGGQVGIVGHVEIDDRTLIATRGGVSKSLKSGTYRGSPAIPIQEYNRQKIHVRKLDKHIKRIEDLEIKLEELTQKLSSSK